MTDKQNGGTHSELSVRLNEAFERLEKQQEDTSSPREAARGAAGAPRSSVAGVLGVVLALVAIGLASYAAWTTYLVSRNQQVVARLEARLGVAERGLVQDQAQLAAVDKKLRALSAANAANKKAMGQLQQQVTSSLASIRERLGTSGKDWLYAEVEYLLRLANQRVVMEGDVKSALLLFHDADNIVRQASGITAFDLRKAIADDIARLEAVTDVDVDGIFARLDALSGAAGKLRQIPQRFKAPAPATPPPSAATGGFGAQLLDLLHRAGARLATLVDFRRDSERIQPILPPKEAYYLYQNLVLKIQMAQLALLRGDETVYAGSLRDARSWVSQHFDPDDVGTTAMEKELSALAAIDIARKMPDVSDSLKQVKKLMVGLAQTPARSAEPAGKQ